jgi:hypothetical protein
MVGVLGVLGAPDVRPKILAALPRVTSPAARFVAGLVIDELSPTGDPAVAGALQRVSDAGATSGDPARIADPAIFGLVVDRLQARAQ